MRTPIFHATGQSWLAVAVVTLAGLQTAKADVREWNPPTSSSDWSLGDNWGGTAPLDDLTSDIAWFRLASYTNKQPDAGARSIAGLEIGDDVLETGALTLSGTGLGIGAEGILKRAGSGTTTIATAGALGAAQGWTNQATSALVLDEGVNLGTHQLEIAGGGEVRIRQILEGAGHVVVRDGGNLVIDPGGNNNTFSGGLSILSGTVTAMGSNSSGATGAEHALGTGKVIIGATSGSADAHLVLNGRSANPAITANVIEVAAGSTGVRSLTTAPETSNTRLSGGLKLDGDLVMGVASNNWLEIQSALTGNGNLIVENQAGATGYVNISSAQSGFGGNVVVRQGDLYLNGSLNNNTTLYIGAAGALRMGNSSYTAGGLSDFQGAGGILDRAPTGNSGRTLTLGGGGTYAFSGVISDTLALGAIGLTFELTGSGSQTLSGANTFRGAVTVTSGVLTAAHNTALGATTGGTTVSNGGTLRLQGGITIGAEALSLTGAGADGQSGALVNVSGNNEYGGALDLRNITTGTYISSESGLLNLSNTATVTSANDRRLYLTGAGDGIFAASMNAWSIDKQGSGTWKLTGTYTFTPVSTVHGGTLILNGSYAAPLVVNAGNLGGTGSTSGNVTIGNASGSGDAGLTPGDGGIGHLSVGGALSLRSDAVFRFEINTTLGTADSVSAASISIDSNALFSFTDLGNGTGVRVGDVFTLMSSTDSPVAGAFSNLADGLSFDENGVTYLVSYSGGLGSNDLTLQVMAVTAIPEPSNLLLMAAGAGALLLYRRRKR